MVANISRDLKGEERAPPLACVVKKEACQWVVEKKECSHDDDEGPQMLCSETCLIAIGSTIGIRHKNSHNYYYLLVLLTTTALVIVHCV